MFEPFANHLGLPSLLDHLDEVLTAAKKLNALSSTKAEGADLLQLLKDHINIVTSLNDLATRERRRASPRVRSLSEADLIQLQQVCISTAAIAQECIEFLGILQPQLEAILNARETHQYLIDGSLEDQIWYDEVFRDIRLRADVIRILDLAIVHLCRDPAAGTSHNSPNTPETGSPSHLSTLNYYIIAFSPKLNSLEDRNTAEVSDPKNMIAPTPA
jgi:hypothetical protein